MAPRFQLFGPLNEIIVFLLGAMMLLLAMTGRFSLPARPMAWMVLGVFLIYWGARAWIASRSAGSRWHAALRAGSLAVVGLIMLLMAWLPVHHMGLLLGIAGAVLVLRGLAGAALLVRPSVTE
jgi:hypothetical protein